MPFGSSHLPVSIWRNHCQFDPVLLHELTKYLRGKLCSCIGDQLVWWTCPHEPCSCESSPLLARQLCWAQVWPLGSWYHDLDSDKKWKLWPCWFVQVTPSHETLSAKSVSDFRVAGRGIFGFCWDMHVEHRKSSSAWIMVRGYPFWSQSLAQYLAGRVAQVLMNAHQKASLFRWQSAKSGSMFLTLDINLFMLRASVTMRKNYFLARIRSGSMSWRTSRFMHGLFRSPGLTAGTAEFWRRHIWVCCSHSGGNSLAWSSMWLAANTVIFTLLAWDGRDNCRFASDSHDSHWSSTFTSDVPRGCIIALRYGASPLIRFLGGSRVRSVPLQAITLRIVLSSNSSWIFLLMVVLVISFLPTLGSSLDTSCMMSLLSSKTWLFSLWSEPFWFKRRLLDVISWGAISFAAGFKYFAARARLSPSERFRFTSVAARTWFHLWYPLGGSVLVLTFTMILATARANFLG